MERGPDQQEGVYYYRIILRKNIPGNKKYLMKTLISWSWNLENLFSVWQWSSNMGIQSYLCYSFLYAAMAICSTGKNAIIYYDTSFSVLCSTDIVSCFDCLCRSYVLQVSVNKLIFCSFSTWVCLSTIPCRSRSHIGWF